MNADWIEIDKCFSDSVAAFSDAIRAFPKGKIDESEFEDRREANAFSMFMLQGYNSLEAGLKRIVILAGEPLPTGESWHRDLISRATVETEYRPAVFGKDFQRSADVVRGFRQHVLYNYGNFDIELARPPLKAAIALSKEMLNVLWEYKRKVDPEATNTLSPEDSNSKKP